MKKIVLPLTIAAMMLASCSGTPAKECSEPDYEAWASANGYVKADSVSSGDVQAGATDTGKGGLNFGDVDWSEDLKKEAVDTYLSGIGSNHREMMQVATISNGKPQIASVEYYMDTTNHWFFGSSESDTGKIQDMKKDGTVALYWTRQLRAADMGMAPNYFTSYGVEIQGKANFYSADEVNALSSSEKTAVVTIARGYYKSMGAQYAAYYDSTSPKYMDDATFVSKVFGSKTTTPYIIKPSKIVITSPYLLFVANVVDEAKEDGHYYAFQTVVPSTGAIMTLAEYNFLPKSFLDKALQTVRDAKKDQTINKFTTMKADYSGATGLKTQVTLTF